MGSGIRKEASLKKTENLNGHFNNAATFLKGLLSGISIDVKAIRDGVGTMSISAIYASLPLISQHDLDREYGIDLGIYVARPVNLNIN
ncbi:MAG: hypothetical protein ACXWT3_14950 [Methylococcaceae bacterium]